MLDAIGAVFEIRYPHGYPRGDLPHDLDGCREHIPCAALCVDEFGLVHTFEFPAQARDLRIDRSIVQFVVVQPGQAEKLIAR